MTAAKKTTDAPANPADDLGADQVQQMFDEANEKGYFGETPDEAGSVVDIIVAEELASWLRDSSLVDDASLEQIVDLVNNLIAEAWVTPEDPVPARVTLLALSIGARAWVNSPAMSNLSSTSVTVDDGSTTEKYREPSRVGVYLTADEVALLNGERRARSVRLVAYGEV
jgi:hypothetical protein